MCKKGDNLYALMAGGRYLQVNKEEYDMLYNKIEEHLKKHLHKGK